MIIGEQKPLDEIQGLLGEAEKVLVVGCGTCVTVCFAGGSREAQILASSLRMSSKLDGHAQDVSDVTVQRQCEWEYIDPLRAQLDPFMISPLHTPIPLRSGFVLLVVSPTVKNYVPFHEGAICVRISRQPGVP